MKGVVLCLMSLFVCKAAEVRPNFVIILADDMGWNDAGFTGNRAIETPNLDRLAREGVEFTEACASAPNCAPTRACLLTGQYPPRHGIYTVVDERHAPGSPHHKLLAAESREALPTESVTLAEALRAEGYATGMFGMWNLGRGRSGPTTPTGQGFDVFLEPKQIGFEKDAYRNAKGAYAPDALTDAALQWIDSAHSKPFFLYLAFHDVHEPFDPKPELLEKYRHRNGQIDPALAATVEAMDANIGSVLASLERLGVQDHTYVIFTSDNGGSRRTVAPLRGGKGTLYQGGLRVPAVIRGPGIRTAKSDQVMLSMDWFPTVIELSGSAAAKNLDGRSLVPVLRGAPPPDPRDTFWHFPCYIGGGGPCSAMRSGQWKLIEQFESGRVELYDLSKDPGENHDLSSSDAKKTAELLAKLHVWQDATHAPRITQPNPAYDPSAAETKGGRQDRDSRKPKKP